MAKKLQIPLYILATTIVVFGLYLGGIFAGANVFFTDILYSTTAIKNPIVIIAIDDESLQTIGQWPWKRAEYAKLLEQLEATQPRAIAFDVLFSEPSRYGTIDDMIFAKAIENFSDRIILATQVVYGIAGNTVVNKPLAIFGGERGHVNLSLDKDNVARKLPTEITIGAEQIQPISYALVQKIAPAQDGKRIPYRGSPGTVATISFKDVLSGDVAKIPPQAYILVGATAESLHDTHSTPLSHGKPMAGVEINAQIADAVLSGDYLSEISTYNVFILIFLFVLISSLTILYIRNVPIAISLVGIVFIANLVLGIIFFEKGGVVPIAYTSLSILASSIVFGIIRYLSLAAEKRQLKTVFEKYVSEEVLTDILQNPHDIGLGGKEYMATILFSDIRGFTTFSEKMSPKDLIHFLNQYLTQMTNIVLENRGVIDKYIGDAIMAFWGAPIVSNTHAYQAILSAVAMVDSLKSFNEQSTQESREPIAMGIGLNTGSMIAGNIGSEKRFDYTAIGDSVNLASRLESQTKHYGVSCIASEYTIDSLNKDQQQKLKDAGIRWREIDRLVVKGKVKPVALFEILSPLQAVDTEVMRNSFEKLYTAYTNAQWDTCITQATEHLKQWKDTPGTIILERAKYYKEHPTEWVGYYVAKNK